MLPGSEPAAETLAEGMLEILQQKGVSRVSSNLHTMSPGDIRLAEKMGFEIKDWGFKVYYAYEMRDGYIDLPVGEAIEIEPERDLEQCAVLAAR